MRNPAMARKTIKKTRRANGSGERALEMKFDTNLLSTGDRRLKLHSIDSSLALPAGPYVIGLAAFFLFKLRSFSLCQNLLFSCSRRSKPGTAQDSVQLSASKNPQNISEKVLDAATKSIDQRGYGWLNRSLWSRQREIRRGKR